MTDAPHWRWEGEDLWLELQGKPGARRDGFGRVMGGRLQVLVAAAPEDGKATARLLVFLAEQFGVARADVELRYGLASPKKGVCIRRPRALPADAAVGPRATREGPASTLPRSPAVRTIKRRSS